MLSRVHKGVMAAYRLPLLLLLVLLSACQPSAQGSPATSQQPVLPPTPTPTSQPISATREPTPQAATLTPPPTPVSSPTPETNLDAGCDQPGQLSLHLLPVPALDQTLEFYAYLPPCYAASPEDFSTLILLHGQGYKNSQWLELGLVNLADQLILSEQISPLVILLPLERYDLQDPNESNYGKLIMDSLLPWAAEFLPACIERECLGIGGISRGGAWALWLGVKYPERFSAIGMHSAPPFSLGYYGLLYALRDLGEAKRPHLYLDAGEQDPYYGYISAFHEDLVTLDIQHTWTIAPGEHKNTYWQAHLQAYLLWYGSQLSLPKME